MGFGGFSGLGNVYPGMLAGQTASANADLASQNATDAMTKAAGEAALGKTFASIAQEGQQGPQPPNPGQPSVPSQPPQQQGQPMNIQPQGSPQPGGQPPAGVAPPGNAPAGGSPSSMGQTSPQGYPQLDLQTVAARIQKANPGIHPEVLMAALERASPLLNQQAKSQLDVLQFQLDKQKAENSAKSSENWLQYQKDALDAKGERSEAWLNRGRNSLNEPPQESTYVQFQRQKLNAKRAAQGLPPLLPGQPVPGMQPDPGASAPADNSTTPPLDKLKEGHVTTFKNGQIWTLKNGQPIRVSPESGAPPSEAVTDRFPQ